MSRIYIWLILQIFIQYTFTSGFAFVSTLVWPAPLTRKSCFFPYTEYSNRFKNQPVVISDILSELYQTCKVW